MIKKIEYNLEYRIKGQKHNKLIEIDFVPNQRHADWAQLQSDIIDVQSKWNNLRMIDEEIILLLKERPEGFQESISSFKDNANKLKREIEQLSKSGIIERRHKLLKDILTDNGYADDELLMSEDFWNNNVDPACINELLNEAIYKDIDKKKVIH